MPTDKNMFADATTIEGVIAEAIGYGSTCWENMEGTGVFQSERAVRAVDEATIRVRELIASDWAYQHGMTRDPKTGDQRMADRQTRLDALDRALASDWVSTEDILDRARKFLDFIIGGDR